ncbi:hypothetical protein JXA80_10105 [bacterium]|nr:hypothetical protein [candidate division CSSED10-310 bacterium]
MNRLAVIVMTSIILITGCGRDTEPIEPTPDLQLKMQSKVDMGRWLLSLRYVNAMCDKVAQSIEERFDEQNIERSQREIAAIIEYFKQPDGLLPRLGTRFNQAEGEQVRLMGIAEKDLQVFNSLNKANGLTGEYLSLISTVPDSMEAFTENRSRVRTQFESIVKVLSGDYPESADDLSAAMSEDNLEYRADIKHIQDVPTPMPAETPTPEIPLPTATPTIPPARTWIDDKGVMHMGHHPPEGASLHEVKNRLSGSVDTTTVEPTPSDQPSASDSRIWVDENGITHMGQNVPEGSESRSVKEIPLMIE